MRRFLGLGEPHHWVIAGLLGDTSGGDGGSERLPFLFDAAKEPAPDVACRYAALACWRDCINTTQPSAACVSPPVKELPRLQD